jgi:hypothetical protein
MSRFRRSADFPRSFSGRTGRIDTAQSLGENGDDVNSSAIVAGSWPDMLSTPTDL